MDAIYSQSQVGSCDHGITHPKHRMLALEAKMLVFNSFGKLLVVMSHGLPQKHIDGH